jgi:hypothetical protein
MLARWGIRLGSSLAGIALGLIVSATLLDRFSLDGGALVIATLLFWIVHIVIQFLACGFSSANRPWRSPGSWLSDQRSWH